LPIVRKNTVRLPGDVAHRVRAGHPWVYREAIGPRALIAEPGTQIDCVDEDGEFVGRGLYDGDSAIALRVFVRAPDVPVDGKLIKDRVRAAIALRRKLIDLDKLGSARMINAESDGLPGIVVERYGDYLVIQLFTSAVMGLRNDLYDALEAELHPKAIYEQRRFKSLGGEAPRQVAAELVRGAAAPVELEVKEDDLTFVVDVTAPLSTGLFADLREGRRAVRQWAAGRRVLNLFSYTGALSVACARAGAATVTSVDTSAGVQAWAAGNFGRSGLSDAKRWRFETGDAVRFLTRAARDKERYDVVLIDPPTFSTARGSPWTLDRDYPELIAKAIAVIPTDGLLWLAANTHELGSLAKLAQKGLRAANRTGAILEQGGLPPEYPTLAAQPHDRYLQVCLLRLA
jgi:23S rRNA (cytosine1962-C5)-methyltransferase